METGNLFQSSLAVVINEGRGGDRWDGSESVRSGVFALEIFHHVKRSLGPRPSTEAGTGNWWGYCGLGLASATRPCSVVSPCPRWWHLYISRVFLFRGAWRIFRDPECVKRISLMVFWRTVDFDIEPSFKIRNSYTERLSSRGCLVYFVGSLN